MKKRFFLAACLSILILNTQVPAKNVTLEELERFTKNNYVPAIDVRAKAFDSSYWAYKSLENITGKYGLLVGEAGDKLDGNKPLTRNEAAVILVNLIGKVEQDRINLTEAEQVQINILKNEFSQEMATLTGRVATLENNVHQLQGIVSKIQAEDKANLKTVSGEEFKIGGALQVRYNGVIQKGADSDLFSPNLSIPYSEVNISGKLAPHLKCVTSIFPNRVWGGSSSLTTSGGILGDAFISTDIVPNHNIIAGQTRVPIGVEGTQATGVLDTIDRSQISRNFSNFRDIGVKVAGSWPLFDYYVGAFNGSLDNNRDYNREMGIGGWFNVKPLYKNPEYGKLELGGGYYRQKNGNTINAANLSEHYRTQTYGVALAYKYKKIGLKSEWARKQGYRNQNVFAQGLFVQTTYDLTPKLQLIAKYDIFDPDIHSSITNRNIEYTLGTTYFFAGNNLKLQLNGVFVNNQLGKDSKRLMALTQYMF